MLYSNMTECLIFVFVVVGMYNLRLLTSSICLVDRYEETPGVGCNAQLKLKIF